MYGFLYLDGLHVHTAIVRRINICMPSFIWMYACLPIFGCIACSYRNRKENKQGEQTYVWLPLFGCIAYSHSNCKENKDVFGFLYFDVLHVHTIVKITNIYMASFIWMYCMFIQQL